MTNKVFAFSLIMLSGFLRAHVVATAAGIAALAPAAEQRLAAGTPIGSRFKWQMSLEELRAAAADTSHSLYPTIQLIMKMAPLDLENAPNLIVLPEFRHGGKLSGTPEFEEFIKVHNQVGVMMRFAMCSKVAPPELAAKCARAGGQYLMRWATTFKFRGETMAENDVLFLLAAADLLITSEKLPPEIDSWARSLIKTSDDALKEEKKKHPLIEVNNVNTWRLAQRGMAAQLLGDARLIAENTELLSKHAEPNLNPSTKWKPNPKLGDRWTEAEYGSFDFRNRDAIHYHVGNLEAWAWIQAMIPNQVKPEVRAEVVEAFDFTKDYFQGTKTHQEFVNSTVGFDAKRAEAGLEGFKGAWDPKTSYKALMLARAAFPEIRSWTEAVAQERYDPGRESIVGLQWTPENSPK